MRYDINLLTKEEKVEQIQEKVVKVSSVLTVLLLLVVSGFSAKYYFEASDLKKLILSEDQKIETARDKINSMKSTEVLSRNLSKKQEVLREILDNRLYYSELLSQFYERIPSGVGVKSLSFTDKASITLSGTASNYLLVSDFLKNLNNSDAENIFQSATLSSVKLNASSSTVDYSLVVGFDKERLKDGY